MLPYSFTLSLLLLLYSSQVNMDSQAFSTSIANFAAKFCNELEKNKNVVSSPLSAEFVLALLTLGSTEPAHSELISALGIPDDKAIRNSFSSLSSKLRSIKGVTLDVANRIYIKQGPYKLASALNDDAVKVFDAGIEQIDFANSVAAADVINKWVESKTHSRIKDLLSSDSLSEDTRLVLVNALYFKGSWKAKFHPNHTRDQTFHVNANTKIEIPMMYQKNHYKLGTSEHLNAQLLEMPYEKEEASMIIVLPNEIEGLNSVMQKLAAGHDLMSDLQNMYSMEVEVTIPKFKIETEIDLIPLLKKLGITSIFNSSGKTGLDNLLNPPQPMYVSQAVQKAFIEVNEEGAEAAAATAFGIMMTCAMISFEPTPQFVADRPFLAAIFVDGAPYFLTAYRMVMMLCCAPPLFRADRPFVYCLKASDNILFVGVYCKPQ